MTLVALLALTAHAWAEESETIETKADDENIVYDDYTSTHFKITASLGSNDDGIILWNNSTSGTAKIEALNGEIITKIEMQFRNGGQHATLTTTTEGDLVATDSEYAENDISVTDINATSVTIGTTYSDASGVRVQIDKFVIHYANPVPLNWDATAKTASIAAMPAGNVTVNVKYFAQAELAKSTGETPEPLAPAAIANVPANTDAPIVTAGTVANIGTSEVKQGTLMYFVIQPTDNTVPDTPDYDDDGWTDKVPTANELKQGDVYVWYYIEGAEPDNIADRTDDNTRSDSDIMPLGASGIVTLLPEPTYDVSLNKTGMAEGEPALWSAKSTNITTAVNLGEADLEGVKKSETVTVTYTGTQRKIIGVKAEKAKTITIGEQKYTVLNGETWSQFITRHQLSSWSVTQYTTITWNVCKDNSSAKLQVSSDGTNWTLLEFSAQNAPIDTDKQYQWGPAD